MELDAFGTVQAAATVEIRSQVSEILKQVSFQEGDNVAAGDTLFLIERRPFQVALDKAKATLAHDQIEAANAQAEANRAKSLADQKVGSQADVDQAVAAAAALAQTVKGDQATVAGLQLQLDHCRIVAPIAGRAGKIRVKAGNLVQSNGDPLVVINQISPIKVFFAVPQDELERVRSSVAAGALEVDATLPDAPEHPETGHLDFVDNNVDPATGTIQLGATFANTAERLWPGRYVQVRIRLATQPGAIVVPGHAVVEGGSEGQYVFVIEDGKAVLRKVVVSRTSGDLDIIASGVKPGETVVTDGQAQLEDGTRVEVLPAGPEVEALEHPGSGG